MKPSASLSVAVALLSIVGCESNPSYSDDENVAVSSDSDTPGVIAELRVRERSFVRFIDERLSCPECGIGMLVLNAPEVSAGIAELKLTPLEVFLALAPEAVVPGALRADHFAGAATADASAPRSGNAGHPLITVEDLTAPRRVSFAQDVIHSTNRCNFNAMDTAGDYCDHFDVDRANDTADAWDCVDDQTGSRTVSAGSSAERWLGLCARASIDWKVQVEGVPGTWSDVSGTAVSVVDDDEVAYHSSAISIAHQRSSITASSTEHYSSSWARD
ncbi:hypothetical protein [Nannocystis punicea]|uniref:Lipoprotein n=1 Tax=Nannocystis punicea TaxID=2995304 RepID=A0ABY7H115_9BACT|nr:hypothetical protein [Nannocystis poenicansa]WAS92764.1 hypothetical protein O0S08_41850 [Nannocystis poenicansa]